MAIYKDASHVTRSDDAAFDKEHDPGMSAPYAGIFRCTKCGHEIGIAAGHTLPPQTHPKHPPSLGPIKWTLLVFAQHNE